MEKSNLDKVIESEQKKNGLFAEIFDWLSSVFTAVICFIVIFTLFARLITVDGRSMMNTLVDGDRLIVSDLFYTPNYGDVVIVFADKLMGADGVEGKPIVKRVIGLEGDRIRIDFNNGIVYRNDVELDEPYIAAKTRLKEDFPNNTDVVIEKGKVFVMGDNRNESKDSRSNDIGQVDVRYIMGKAYLRVWPINNFCAL